MTPARAREHVTRPRPVEDLVVGRATSDGAGVDLIRVLSQDLQQRLDPFLLLDAFGSDDPEDYIAGFPDHPHRGFETVTYMLAGRMRHQDSAGHDGLLEPGGVQWMMAGRGVIHSEMPEQQEGRLEGFQLWLNLSAKDKMRSPWYRNIQRRQIPEFVTPEGVTVRVIAGSSHEVTGALRRPTTDPLYLDVHLPAGARFAQALPAQSNAFVYVYRGDLSIGTRAVARQHLAILANDPGCDGVVVRAETSARALLIAGRPLHEPIARYGPFVMNSQEEIVRAITDFREGRFAEP
ncbi:MAG: pirin family protein [Betaproteobacteria bacterium]|nr:pirin family protein [Betaproteobacteria bacterium]